MNVNVLIILYIMILSKSAKVRRAVVLGAPWQVRKNNKNSNEQEKMSFMVSKYSIGNFFGGGIPTDKVQYLVPSSLLLPKQISSLS